jgi:hypothetical protein
MATTALSEFKAGDKVILTEKLKGVPVGTPGKIIHMQGLTWTRYWVWFENGIRMGTIPRTKLATADEWERKQNGGDEVVVAGKAGGSSTAAGGSGDGDGGSGGGGAVMADVNGVPGHLIERSRLARERWAAKKG